MLANASYFAFTATPKNKTLEMFGEPLPRDAEGKVKHKPFHSYTMKQAIDEKFILDVLKFYSPIYSYYKLPAPREEDLSAGIVEAIDMDSYRVEKKAATKIDLADADAEIEPIPADIVSHKPEPELDLLSNILKTFNEQFGTQFADADRVVKRIREDIAPKVAADVAYQNAKENTPHTARMAHDQALAKVMQHLLKDDTQVYKQFVENESFKRFVGDLVYRLTSPAEGFQSRARK
jgi:type I site-specific restriction-modification system R (restriction) subunit